MNRQMPDTPLIDTLRDPACGSTEDKLRLFLLNYICSDNVSDVICLISSTLTFHVKHLYAFSPS